MKKRLSLFLMLALVLTLSFSISHREQTNSEIKQPAIKSKDQMKKPGIARSEDKITTWEGRICYRGGNSKKSDYFLTIIEREALGVAGVNKEIEKRILELRDSGETVVVKGRLIQPANDFRGKQLLVETINIAGTQQDPITPEATALEQRMLECALINKPLDKGMGNCDFPDAQMVANQSNIVLKNVNINTDHEFRVPGKRILVMTAEQIQSKADKEGDFLYFSFNEALVRGNKAAISLSLTWAVAKKSKLIPLSGGCMRVIFKKSNGIWRVIGPVESAIS